MEPNELLKEWLTYDWAVKAGELRLLRYTAWILVRAKELPRGAEKNER